MKNRHGFMLVLGILALTFGIMAAGCDNGTTSDTPNPPKSYGGSSDDSTYLLVIDGDKYTLTVSKDDGASKISSGSVTVDGDGVMTLFPDNAPGDSFKITVDEEGIDNITGEITFDDDTTETAPESVTPTTPEEITITFPDIQLYRATGWGQGEATGLAPYSGTGAVQQITETTIEKLSGQESKPLNGVSGSISADGKLTLTLPAFVDDTALFDMSSISPGLKGGVLILTPSVTPLNDMHPSVILYANKNVNYQGKNYVQGWNWGDGGIFTPAATDNYKIVYELEQNIDELLGTE